MKVAAVGFCCIDIYENLNIHYPTGNGIDCIINLSKKGIQTSAVSIVGTDAYGQEMLDVLKSFKIDVSHMQIAEGHTSIFRMALRNGVDRVHVENIEGVMKDFKLRPEDIEFIKTHDFVHTDLTGKILHQLPDIKTAKCQVIFDFSNKADEKNTAQLLPHIDYAFFSCESKKPEIKEFLRYAKAFGPKLVTATFGEEGSICFDGNNFHECGISKVPVVNTVGAGDAFIAGFMYGVINHLDIPGCLQSGSDTAAEIVQIFNPY